MKGSYFGFGSPPNNRLTCIQAQKTLSYSYNMHFFLPYLLNDSQTIRSTIHFSKPLLCLTLICGDRSISFSAPKAAPSGKEWICMFIQTNVKIKFSQVCARSKRAGNMLMFHVDISMKRLGIHFKNDSFQWFRVDSFFWETITLHGALSDLKLCRMFSFT